MSPAEVRRSSRATKGQNKRLQDELKTESETAAVRAAQKKTGTTKKQKKEKKKVDVDVDDEVDPDEGEVKCICGATTVDEDDDRAMAECEKCLTWQHVECMLGQDDPKIVPDGYQCNDCKSKEAEEKQSTKEEPKEDLQKDLEKKQITEEAQKESQEDVQEDKEPIKDKQADSDNPKAKSEPSESTPEPAKPSNLPKVVRIGDLHDKVRESVASGLKLIFLKTALPEALSSGTFKLPDQVTPEGFAERLAVKIESAMYDKLANKPSSGSNKVKSTKSSAKKPETASVEVGQKYREKFRSLSFNLRDDKNPQLRSRIVKGELTPVEIVTLSTEHMLNPELQKLAETVRKESIRESVLKADDAPRLRKTHKGEEFVELDEQTEHESLKRSSDNATAGSGKTGSIKKRKHAADFWDASSGSKSKAGAKSTEANNDENAEGSQDGSNDELGDDRIGSSIEPRVSANYDKGYALDDVATYSPVNSPGFTGGGDEDLSGDEHIHGFSGNDNDNEDEDDEELANIINGDDDDDDGTKSGGKGNKNKPKEFPEIGIWMGNVSMTGITQFDGSAIHLQGAGTSTEEFDPYESWSEVFDVNAPIVIDGRLDEKVAGNYLYNIKSSKSIVSFILRANAGQNAQNEQGFRTIYDYYHSRKKVGVIKHRKHNVKDAYLIPISSSEPVPAYLWLGQEAEEHVTQLQAKGEDILICLFVVTPFGRPSANSNYSGAHNGMPLPTAKSVPIPRPVRGAGPNAGRGAPVPTNTTTAPPTSVLSSKDFEILKGVLATNANASTNATGIGGGGNAANGVPRLPSNPQMLLDLLQETQKNR